MDIATKTQRDCEQRVAEEYLSSLSDLNCNSKPLINMLTMLAEENIEYAAVIVKVVEQHISKVPPDFKLPILYLIDSIVKNVKSTYVPLFSQCIVNIFCGVFEKVNEKIRERMYALRQTWNEVFSAQKLYALDVKVKRLDNNWPITAKQPSIHVNPIFLKTATQTIPTEMEKILQDKTRELLELKKRKLELELEATKKHLEEQEKQFSKTADSVMPPVEALVAANALQTVAMRPQHPMPPQVMAAAGVMPPGFMGGPQSLGVNTAIRPPAMYHHNIRGFRPNLHPAMLNEQQQPPQVAGPPPNVAAANNVNKPRVHPVNSALISSVRQRDPRLARQQLHQTSQPSPHTHATSGTMPNMPHASHQQQQQQQQVADSAKSGKHERSSSGHKSNRKSPTRTSASSNGSSNRSSGRSSKSSSRDKDRERKQRSESKSSTNSSSSAASLGSSLERKKTSSTFASKSSSDNRQLPTTRCDKDAFEIAPLSSAFKRKSTSPSSSPGKNRDSKRSNKSRSARSKTSSRSPSPQAESYKDTDLRRMSTSSASSSMITSPEKRPKVGGGDSDQEGVGGHSADHGSKPPVDSSSPSSSTATTNIDKKNLLSAVNVAAAAPPATTASSSSATAAVVVATTVSSRLPLYPTANPEAMVDAKDAKCDSNEDDASKQDGQVSKEQDEDHKKRSLAPVKDEEPLAKKSKSTKLDNLFGTEDVDLRQLMPPMSSAVHEDKAPPPPPFNIGKETNENWDNVKGDLIKSPIKKSSLEDVRAKLAKTAKLNKLSKLDKSSKDYDHRNKLAELQMNEDTQEANDEKIRTMIAQAQELLESNSINQEQYKNLVKTVMSINEVNKLKEAKRRESLNALKDRLNDDGGSNDSERNAAREAILKKRIPKLSKSQLAAANEQLIDSLSCDGSNNSNSGGNLDEPMRVDVDKQQHDSNDEPPLRNSRREKRGHKSSKWSDRIVEPPPPPPSVMMPGGQLQQQRPWNAMMAAQNKRGPAFRPNAPVNVRPPWPMGNNNSNNMPNQFPKGVPPMGGGHMRGNALPPVAPPSQQQQIPSQMIPKPCNSIDNPQEDIVRTITIDGNAKEIRFYDEVAIVFMEVDQPREIGFQNGQRTIYIDNHEPINLQFNHDYKPVLIDGETLNLRFGFPSRELYIDENWYEIYFGGPAIGVPVRNKIHMLKAEGPPPQVNIGPLRRDLVVGKINMIVDAHNVIPLFLDARLQVFKLSDQEHTIQFADNLLTVLLDGTPTRVEYGGLPKSLYLGGKKYFVRFGALPQGVIAGKVQIKGMLYVETSPPAETETANTSPVAQSALLSTDNDMNAVDIQKRADNNVPILPAASLSNINIDELFQKLVSTGILGGASGILPAVNNVATQSAPAATTSATTTTPANATATTDSLAGDEVLAPAAPAAQQETIKPINLSKPESIKTRQAAIVATLYSGMQCSSCGVRFPPEQTIKYSQHLDWHFRQNRRERDSSRKAHARKWYYDLNDWIQYEEVEDVEEREKNFLDAQQNDVDLVDETSNQRSTNSPPPSCPAGSEGVDRACDMCQEKFEQFYNEDQEEWHLRGAMRVEDKIYHPLCYEDYKASLNPPPAKPIDEESAAEEMEEPSLIQIDDDNAVDIVIKVEDDKGAKAEDDDDDVIVLPNEEPSVTEIYDDDDDEYVPANVTREHMGNVIEDEEAGGDLNETTESDVEIQEPHIPFTDLDTYVEKELPPASESSKFMNVKIKEEPKEDEDEDDGFEDVGTVLIAPDEISVHSSEETQTHMIESSTSAMSPLVVERPSSRSPSSVHNDENNETTETPATDLNISMDGNLETGDEHNLSAVGPVPTVPLASLVNKIKINITKNTVTTSSTASSNSAAAMLSAANTCKTNSISSLSDQSKGSSSLLGVTAANPIPTISTIPVLCGGGTTISSTQSSSLLGGTMYDEAASSIPSLIGGGVDDNSVSTISVIGSIYGNNGSAAISRPVPPAVTNIPAKPAAAPTPPPPVEDTITYELKPALQKASLKKKEKVVCGNETSGLCSIM